MIGVESAWNQIHGHLLTWRSKSTKSFHEKQMRQMLTRGRRKGKGQSQILTENFKEMKEREGGFICNKEQQQKTVVGKLKIGHVSLSVKDAWAPIAY